MNLTDEVGAFPPDAKATDGFKKRKQTYQLFGQLHACAAVEAEVKRIAKEVEN